MSTYNSDRWDEWMRATLAGDQAAYRLLLTELRSWLSAYFSKRTHSGAVEDLVQDTLLTLHAKRQTFDPAFPFGPWISAIARHRWIDHMRKTLKYIETVLEEDSHPFIVGQEIGVQQDIQKLLGLISPEQAKVIKMAKLQEMSVEEIARQTGHSPSSVKVMVHRGMKRMMAAVEEMDDE